MNAAAAMTEPHPTPALPRALHLVDPLPGLPGHADYSLTPLDDIGVLYVLRSLPESEQSIRLFVVTPAAFFPDYAPTVRRKLLRGSATAADLRKGWAPYEERALRNPRTQRWVVEVPTRRDGKAEGREVVRVRVAIPEYGWHTVLTGVIRGR